MFLSMHILWIVIIGYPIGVTALLKLIRKNEHPNEDTEKERVNDEEIQRFKFLILDS